MPKLCLIDASSICYRAFFAIKTGLSTSSGQPTGAVLGFVNMFNRILKELKPDYIGICFDTAKPTLREEKFKEYKIHRPSMPDDLKTQFPLIREFISAYKLKILEKDGFEADDVIATLSLKGEKNGWEVVIVTTDKDMLQLVNDKIRVYNPYRDKGVYFSAKEVKEEFGVLPERIVDLFSLIGDSVDNIPGVKGVGPKTALELLKEFENIDNLLSNSGKIKSERIRDLIQKDKDMVCLSRQLAKLSTDVELDFGLEDLKMEEPDYQKLYDIFTRLEFRGFLKDLKSKLISKRELCGNMELPSSEGGDSHYERCPNVQVLCVKDYVLLKKELERTKSFAFTLDIEEDGGYQVFIYSGQGNIYILKEENYLKDLFSNEELEKIGYDIKKSKFLLHKISIQMKGKIFDIMIAAYLLDPSRLGYELESLLYSYLKIGPFSSDSLILKNQKVGFIYKLKEKLKELLEERALTELFYKLEMPIVDVLFQMEDYGIKLDCDFLSGLSKRMERRLQKLIEEIFACSGREFNINSPKQLREILFVQLKLPVVKKTKTGPSTDEEVLTKLSGSHKIAEFILEYRQINKLKSTYVDALPELCDKKTNRIHSSFLQTGTETGRLSSQNPNLQNIPIKSQLGREIRFAFIPSQKGWFLLCSDYSQIELRILAHLSQDPVLIAAFKNNEDIHKITASLIYQVEEKDVAEQMRDTAKRVNFGIIYGISAYGLAKDLGTEVILAQNFIDAYFLRYTKVKGYIQSQIDFARKNGYVLTIMGRRRYLPQINSSNVALRQFSERQAVNASIQGTAADLIKLAMVNIQRELNKHKLETKMVLQVHDELIFDFPETEKKQLVEIVKKGMEEAVCLDVPVIVSLQVGHNWAQMREL